ncbi:MAG: transglutaminaseTgpA domain-containing protein, partial [Leptolyngbyaceae bacterium]|nr:transglutaminaseTgpA domain-containing protein [Leptolyngbyaceae bacterium]
MATSSGTQRSPSIPIISQGSQQLPASPVAEVEDSLLLRILVQALVIVGIIATDLTATESTDWQIISFWAVPASIVGAALSWQRRRKRNIGIKFALAAGMLLTLAAFFGRLVGELNDTRLALAQLLIQLQVLHSFDLPRRKDLGYSMVIGLILLGVAATLSQTLTFAPALLVFTALSLPVLVLDYRSRLGLVLQGFKLKGVDLAPKRLGLFLLVVVSLGLIIFACLPRLPGYQLRTLPVSAETRFQGRFEGEGSRNIINPGYVRRGRNGAGDTGTGDGTGTGEGQGQGRGQGKLDDTFYYGFGQQINQNLRGALKPKIVLRVRSQAEGFWRVMAFDRYTGQGWEVSRNDQVQTLKRPSWTYQFSIPPITFSRSKTREVVQTYTAVAEIPSVIPVLTQPKELYFPTQEVALDTEGSLRAPTGLAEGLTYSVISQVPYRDRTLLRTASTEYPVAIRKHYLQIPPEIAPKIQQETQRILAKSAKPLTSVYEQSLYLAQYLKQNYTLPQDPFGFPFLGETDDLVETFLFKTQQGYPDHFSTVLTVMLRSIGIPTRLATGFGPGQFNPFTGLYIVRNTDAYAVTEVYFPKYGWFAFDPIPGHELVPPSIEENQTFTILQKFWKWIAGW